MSGKINEDSLINHRVKLDGIMYGITYFLTEEGYSQSTSLFYSSSASDNPKVSFNKNWPVPIVLGFTDELKFTYLLEDVTEDKESLTKFFNKQRILSQQYQLLNLISGE